MSVHPHAHKTSADGLDICCACMIWGSISACTAAVQTYEALLGVRVLLGVSEAVFFPGAIYLLSAWYSKHELGVRIAGKFRHVRRSDSLADSSRTLLFPTIRKRIRWSYRCWTSQARRCTWYRRLEVVVHCVSPQESGDMA